MSTKEGQRDEATPGTLTVLMVPGRGGESRTFRISYGRLRWIAGGAALLMGGGILLISTWGSLALRASRVGALESEIVQLREQEARVEALAEGLAEVEAAYENIRVLFGAADSLVEGDLWLPPPTGPSPRTREGTETDLPTDWPLTEAGFITQALLDGAGADHPGIDIAVASGSYVRASGGGTISETGVDAVYGNYVVVDHGRGYRTRYAHASVILTKEGNTVHRGEVIALSGSSGRSTAPHLHFEVLQEGQPIDPLSLVAQP